MPNHFKGSSKSLLILGEQMMGLKNILKFSKRNTAPLRKTVSKLPHILARHFRDRKEIAKFYKKLSFMLSRDIFL